MTTANSPSDGSLPQSMTIRQLKLHVAGLDANPSRTRALEQRIRIGTGFHGKWYRSQQEHMLGWLVVQEGQALKQNRDPASLDARRMWNRLKCSPLMFWLAEAADVPAADLTRAERAAEAATLINPRDGDPHGKLMREVLPWDLVAAAIRRRGDTATDDLADQAARQAFDRLTSRVSAYREYREWVL